MNQVVSRSVTLSRLLIASYAALLIFVAIMRYVEYNQTQIARNKINTISKVTNYKLKLLLAVLKNNDALARTVMVQFPITDSESVKTNNRLVNSLLIKNDSSFLAFPSLTGNEKERMIFQKLVMLNNETKKLNDSLFNSYNQKESSLSFISAEKKEFYDFDSTVHQFLDQISTESEKEIKEVNNRISILSKRKELSSYFFISLFLALGLCIGNILRKLRKAENKYRLLFDLSPLPKYFVDTNSFHILETNAAAVELYGYTKEEFKKMTLFDLRQIKEAKKENLKKQIKACTKAGSSFTNKAKHYKKNGRPIDVEINSRIIYLDNRKVFLVTISDITEKEKLEKKSTRAIIKIQEDERLLLGAELHDNVGQILASTQIYLGMAANIECSQREKNLAEARKYLSTAISEIRNISHRVSPVFFEQISFPEAINNLLQEMNPDSKFKIDFEYNKDVLSANIDPDIKLNIYRIVQEQLKNILKYSNATGIKLWLKMNNNKLYLKIADNGIGFDINKVKMGIGLMNIKKRAEMFSGRFTLDTAPQNGCSVIVEIPFATDEAA